MSNMCVVLFCFFAKFLHYFCMQIHLVDWGDAVNGSLEQFWLVVMIYKDSSNMQSFELFTKYALQCPSLPISNADVESTNSLKPTSSKLNHTIE